MAMTQNDAALLFWDNTDALGLEHPPQPMDGEFCSSPTFCFFLGMNIQNNKSDFGVNRSASFCLVN